jgi:hypothetical protein
LWSAVQQGFWIIAFATKSVVRSLPRWLKLLLAGLTTLSLVVTLFERYLEFTADITLETITSKDQRDLFATQFKITSHGWLTLYDAWPSCVIASVDLNGPRGGPPHVVIEDNTFSDPSKRIPELVRNEPQTIDCPKPPTIAIPNFFPEYKKPVQKVLPKSAKGSIFISFKYPLLCDRYSRGLQFEGFLDVEGIAHWTPAGGARAASADPLSTPRLWFVQLIDRAIHGCQSATS